MAGDTTTQDDYWDDTDLLKVWDDCVAEYKKYHSIAVHGEPIDKVVSDDRLDNDNQASGYQPEDSELRPKASRSASNQAVQASSASTSQARAAQPVAAASAIQIPPLPANISEQSKALAMSWYYAGYYAGLSEGYTKAWEEDGSGG